MKKNNPRTVSTDTTELVIRRIGRLDKTESSPILIVAGLPSNISEDTLTTIPFAMVFMTQLMMSDATIIGKIAAK